MRLFHFSEEHGIDVFRPRPVKVPSERGPGREWLNGPLVWAIDEPHSMLYLFPRECPRIVIWAKEDSTEAARAKWLGKTDARAVAYMEQGWVERMRAATVYRYEMPVEGFESLGDVGMWVSREAVTPVRVEAMTELEASLAEAGVELRVVEEMGFLRGVWGSSLHASGIRLRNAAGW